MLQASSIFSLRRKRFDIGALGPPAPGDSQPFAYRVPPDETGAGRDAVHHFCHAETEVPRDFIYSARAAGVHAREAPVEHFGATQRDRHGLPASWIGHAQRVTHDEKADGEALQARVIALPSVSAHRRLGWRRVAHVAQPARSLGIATRRVDHQVGIQQVFRHLEPVRANEHSGDSRIFPVCRITRDQRPIHDRNIRLQRPMRGPAALENRHPVEVLPENSRRQQASRAGAHHDGVAHSK